MGESIELERMMTDDTAKLASLVGSRLCHDLISPIGAIQNGLELLEMAGMASDSPELELIRDSCASAAARIRFFRVAFGAAASDQMVSAKEINAILDGIASGSRVSAQWRLAGDQLRDRVQMAFLAFLCCESALPLGGTIQCDDTSGVLSVSATASRLKVDQSAWDVLGGKAGASDLPASQVQFSLLRLLSEGRGTPLRATTGEAGVSIEIG